PSSPPSTPPLPQESSLPSRPQPASSMPWSQVSPSSGVMMPSPQVGTVHAFVQAALPPRPSSHSSISFGLARSVTVVYAAPSPHEFHWQLEMQLSLSSAFPSSHC